MVEPLKPIQSVKKFYLLDYFFILLLSIEKYQEKEHVFNSFKTLKQEHRLGESKYKKLTVETENPTDEQLRRYRYTFGQLSDEANGYNLIKENSDGVYILTDAGKRLLNEYRSNGVIAFNQSLFKLMEKKYNAFKYLVNFLYEANKFKAGFLIFPFYSPRQLNFEKQNIKTSADIIEYSKTLVNKLKMDIKKYLGENKSTEFSSDMENANSKFINKLYESYLLPKKNTKEFNPKKYNVITKRFRDYWITYFLREIYKYQYSMASFDIWTYRGKQIGIINATELYPSFNGRIVYPTSVVMKATKSNDFHKIYKYEDGYNLFIHIPKWKEENQNKFVDYLVKAYFELRRPFQGNFVNLSALKELVCYNMKISEHLFETFLEETYKMNLSGDLKIRISLEVDKLPEETKAAYIKREPVMVDGKYRNIIAIDVTKGEKSNE